MRARLVEEAGGCTVGNHAGGRPPLLVISKTRAHSVGIEDPIHEPVAGASRQREGRMLVSGLATGRSDHGGEQVLGSGTGGVILKRGSPACPILNAGEQSA